MFNLTHLGAENCVTGSCHLLQTDTGLNIMIDCGMAQGNDPSVPVKDWPVKPDQIDYLFLTHVHIDHIGRVPELIELGFDGEIICTHPSKALLIPMLTDALKFSTYSKNTAEKIKQSIDDLSWGFEYGQRFSLKKGVSFKLGNAGHILGSCFIRFEIPRQNEAQPYTIIFSGDLGAKDTPILPDPDIPDACDLLILESTYGDRNHESRKDRIQNLGNLLTKALEDNGKVFIPAFSLGRTQELIYEMDRLFSDQNLKKDFPKLNKARPIPVFIDSPLGLEITKIYASMSEFWDKDAKALHQKGDHPIDFDHLYAVKNFQHHEKLLNISGPAVIIAGSGMCSGGRILAHLENGLEDPVNDVFFVGYQAKGSLGRDICQHADQENGYIRLHDKKISIRAKVYQLSGYSAHADQTGLIQWVQSMPKKPGKIKPVHGDNQSRSKLSAKFISQGYCVE